MTRSTWRVSLATALAVLAGAAALATLAAGPGISAAFGEYANTPPVAADDAATVDEDSVDNAIDVLANDTDADGDPLTITAVTDPANGSATIDDNGTPGDPSDDKVSYTPDPGFSGSDSFDYTISTPLADSDTATVNVTVEAVIACPAVIDNGTIQLGVNCEGHLNVRPEESMPSAGGTDEVGLRFLPTNNESTAPGCLCEGWGAGDATSGVSGGANEEEGGAFNLRLVNYVSTASTAVSVVEVIDAKKNAVLLVTHDYHPSPATPNLYEVTVTIENVSGADVDLRYRRVMDWDVEPTAFNEFSTIQGTAGAANVLFASNNGFETANPLGLRSDLGAVGDFVDSGPADHGALFDFGFGTVAPGGKVNFRTFYGAAANEDSADAALDAVDAEVFSYGQPNCGGSGGEEERRLAGASPSPSECTGDGPDVGTPNTFIFAFAGVGGKPVIGGGGGGGGGGGAGGGAPSPPPAKIDIAVSKSATVSTATVGDTVTFTVTVSNVGGVTASNVTVSDPAPAGMTIVSATPTQGSCSGTSLVNCNLGSLAPGAAAGISITAHADAAGTAVNRATAAANEEDSNTANNAAEATVVIVAPFRPPAAKPAACGSLSVSVKSLAVGKRTVVRITVRDRNGKPMRNARVLVRGGGIVASARTSAKGVMRLTLTPTKAGVVRFKVAGSAVCAKRVGAVGAFQPPITG